MTKETVKELKSWSTNLGLYSIVILSISRLQNIQTTISRVSEIKTMKKYITNNFVRTSCLLLGCLFISFQADAASKDSIREQLVNAKPANESLKFSPIFEGRGDGVVTCPVTGEKITAKNFKIEHSGRTVYFCCKGCYQRGKQLPDKYIKPTMEEQQQAVKAYLAKVPEAPPGEEICNE